MTADADSVLRAPFPYFGGKRAVAADVWTRFGRPRQYIEPFCGSAAILLAAPKPTSLEVVGDASGFIANFWRAVKHQPGSVTEWCDYPVSHIDLHARHAWLMAERPRLGALHDPNWPGDAQIAGWWLWGQCAWIGSGWCEWSAEKQIPHAGDAGRGVQAAGQIPHAGNAGLLTSCGRTAYAWLHRIAARLERVRIVHGDWDRCLNSNHGGTDTAVFLDPPYLGYERLYGESEPVARACEAWARDHSELRIALCGHAGDYDLPGWDAVPWSRAHGGTYAGTKTRDAECIWYSPACHPARGKQIGLFAG